MSKHRDIWIAHFGSIPKDENGRSYEIHHINGNHSDNRIENLKCLSVEEHFNIHFAQGDLGACALIAKRLGMTGDEISALQQGNRRSIKTRQKISEARQRFLQNGGSSWNIGKKGYKLKVDRKGNRYSSKISAADVIFMRGFLKNKIDLPTNKKSDYISQLAKWLKTKHFPELTLPAIRNVLRGKTWADVNFLETSEYEILTPSGFQDFQGIRMVTKQGLVKLTFEDDTVFRCTLDHKIETQDGFKKARDLTPESKCLTSIGFKRVKYLDLDRTSERVYDPVEVANGNRYYANDIVSHNCEFLSSDALLVDSRKLHAMKFRKPIREDMGFKFWKEIGESGTYLVGVDPATGSGNDFTAIEVFEFPSLEQVAELKLNNVNIPLIYSKIKWLLKELRKPNQRNQRAEVLWTFERNGVGEALIALIQNDDAADGGIYLDGVELFNESSNGNNRLGVFTSGKSKLLACMQLKNMCEKVKNGLIIHSQDLLFELKHFAAKGGSYEAKQGATDDLVSATLVITKLLKYLASYDDGARKMVYEEVSPDADMRSMSDEQSDSFGGEAVPFTFV